MSSEYNGNILYVKDDNGEWIPIPSIVGEKGADGEQGPQGEQGEQGVSGVWFGTTAPESSEYDIWINPDGDETLIDWNEVSSKPFEALNEDDFDVDSEGVLSTTLKVVAMTEEEYEQITPEPNTFYFLYEE